MKTETQLSVFYFNNVKGHWEPCLEPFSLSMAMKSIGKKSTLELVLSDPINVNLSVHLGSVINDFVRLWDKSAKRAKRFQLKMLQDKEHTDKA